MAGGGDTGIPIQLILEDQAQQGYNLFPLVIIPTNDYIGGWYLHEPINRKPWDNVLRRVNAEFDDIYRGLPWESDTASVWRV